MQKTIKKLFRQNETYVFLILLALSFLIQVRSGQFYTSNNIVDIASAMIVPGLFAVGEFLVILSGGIDVSFPALASLTAYATTKLFLNLENYQPEKDLDIITCADVVSKFDEIECNAPADFEGKIKLEAFIDLATGKWIQGG